MMRRLRARKLIHVLCLAVFLTVWALTAGCAPNESSEEIEPLFVLKLNDAYYELNTGISVSAGDIGEKIADVTEEHELANHGKYGAGAEIYEYLPFQTDAVVVVKTNEGLEAFSFCHFIEDKGEFYGEDILRVYGANDAAAVEVIEVMNVYYDRQNGSVNREKGQDITEGQAVANIIAEFGVQQAIHAGTEGYDLGELYGILEQQEQQMELTVRLKNGLNLNLVYYPQLNILSQGTAFFNASDAFAENLGL